MQANGLSLSLPVTANGSLETFAGTTYSNSGSYGQNSLSSAGNPERRRLNSFRD